MASKKFVKREDGSIVEITKNSRFTEEREISEEEYERQEFIDTAVKAVAYIFFLVIFVKGCVL